MAGMTDEELKTLCKTSIRITTTAYDGMIESLIGAAKEDISKSCDVDFDADIESIGRFEITDEKYIVVNGELD